jgi:hypothetical protein
MSILRKSFIFNAMIGDGAGEGNRTLVSSQPVSDDVVQIPHSLSSGMSMSLSNDLTSATVSPIYSATWLNNSRFS